jgi:hypothetical protein
MRIQKGTAVGLQLVALLFLQVYSVKPVFSLLFGPKIQSATCQGDHRLCGCSPERIANQTCCCFRFKSLPKACHLKMHCGSKSAARSETNHWPRLVCYPSCGGQPSFITASFEKFLPFDSVPKILDGLSLYYHPIPLEGSGSRSKEPPTPPPKPLYLSEPKIMMDS